MKREQKSLTNKGFSLVELIIVVAIMAVLIGVLAPQYLRYVEKTRLQRDNTAIADFANVLKISATEEDVNAEIAAAGTSGLVYTFTGTPLTATAPATGATKLTGEIDKTIHLSEIQLTSSNYTKATDKPTLVVAVDTNGIVTVKCTKFIENPGDAGDDKNF